MGRINLWEYIQIFFRWRWYFFIPFIIVPIIVTIGSFFLPKVYQSSTIIIIEEKQRILNPLLSNLAVTPSVEERLRTLNEQILSWPHLVEMVRLLNLDKKIKGEKELERLILSIRRRINIKLQGNDLLQISYEDKDPYLTQQVVNTIAATFVKENLFSHAEEANEAIIFMKIQLETYRKNLEESEQKLKVFKEKNILELPGEIDTNLNRWSQAQTSLAEVDLELEGVKRQYALLKEQIAKEKIAVVLESRETNPIVNEWRAKISKLKMEIEDLSARGCTDKHPLVIATNDQIKRLEDQIHKESERIVSSETSNPNPVYQNLQEQLNSVEIQIDSLNARRKYLMGQVENYAAKTQNIPLKEQELAQLTRDTTVNEGIYKMLLEKLESANISKQVEIVERGARFRIVDPARLPLWPIKPQKSRIAFLGIIIGAMVGFGSLCLREYADHSIRGIEQGKKILGLEGLGTISKIITAKEIKLIHEQRRKIIKILLLFIPIIGVILWLFAWLFLKSA